MPNCKQTNIQINPYLNTHNKYATYKTLGHFAQLPAKRTKDNIYTQEW